MDLRKAMRPRSWREIEAAKAEHADRMTANLLAAIACLVLLGTGLFIVEHLDRAAKLERCFEAGRRVCDAPGLRP